MAQREGGEGTGGHDDVMRLYLDDVRRRPLLTQSDERRLARTIAEGRQASRELEENDGSLAPERRRYLSELVARCEHSTRQFVEANLRLVVSIAKRYRHPRLPLSDLVQEGNVGLLQAVSKFDHTKGFRFSTYATFWIRRAIGRSISNTGRMIRLPAEAGATVGRIHATTARLAAERGRPPATEDVAAELGFSPSRVAELLRSAAEPISVSSRLDEEDGPELAANLADPSAEESLEAAFAAVVPDQVDRLLSMLDDRERRILCLRYGFDGHEPRSRAAVGECLGITGERVRQVEARALARLRATDEAGEAWLSLGR